MRRARSPLVAPLSKDAAVSAPERPAPGARQVPVKQPTAYYVIRERRDGPLVPARLQWLDHEPGEPDNKLDRGCLSVFPQVDIAGVYVPPERLLERLYSPTPERPALAPRHWKYAARISHAEYHLRVERMRWAETNRPDDPVLRPLRRVEADQMPLPSFDRENSI